MYGSEDYSYVAIIKIVHYYKINACKTYLKVCCWLGNVEWTKL